MTCRISNGEDTIGTLRGNLGRNTKFRRIHRLIGCSWHLVISKHRVILEVVSHEGTKCVQFFQYLRLCLLYLCFTLVALAALILLVYRPYLRDTGQAVLGVGYLHCRVVGSEEGVVISIEEVHVLVEGASALG